MEQSSPTSSPSYRPGNMERRHSFHGPSTGRSSSFDRVGNSVASVGPGVRASSQRPPGSVAFPGERSFAPGAHHYRDRLQSFGTAPPFGTGSPSKLDALSPGSMSGNLSPQLRHRPGPGSPVLVRGQSKESAASSHQESTTSWNRSMRRGSREPADPHGSASSTGGSVAGMDPRRGSAADHDIGMKSDWSSRAGEISGSKTHGKPTPSVSSTSFPDSHKFQHLQRTPGLFRTSSEPRRPTVYGMQMELARVPRSASEGPSPSNPRSRAMTVAHSDLSRELEPLPQTSRSRTRTEAYPPGKAFAPARLRQRSYTDALGSSVASVKGIKERVPSASRHAHDDFYDVGIEGGLPKDEETAHVPRLNALKAGFTDLYRYLPVDVANDRMRGSEQTGEFHSFSQRASLKRNDVPWPLIVMLFVAWSYAAGAWILGVVFPSASLDFLPGTSMHWHMTKSLVQTLKHLLESEVYGGFFALAFFSVVVPVGKIMATLVIIYKMTYESIEVIQSDHVLLLTVLGYLASYQFVDLYIGIMFVCFFNADASDASFDVGFYWFFSYCFCSICTSVGIENLFESYASKERKDKASPHKDSLISNSSAEYSRLQSASPSGISVSVGGEQVVQVEEVPQLSLEPRANSRLCNMTDMEGVREVTSRMSRESSNPDGRRIEDVCANGHYMPLEAKFCSQCGSTRKERIARRRPAHKMHIDAKIAYFFSACYLLAAISCFFFELLEVRMLMNGIAVDRQALSLAEAMLAMLPSLAHPAVMIFLWLVTVIFPVLYIFSLVIQVTVTDQSSLIYRISHFATHTLRQWAMPDVVCVASLIFLFMIQDEHTLTMPPDGSCAYYIYLSAGFSFFFIRWFSESAPVDEDNSGYVQNTRFAVLSITWLLLCAVIFHGIPGQAPHFTYRSLSTVCQHTQPFLNKAVEMAPASYGNCNDKSSHPPKPCLGDANLQTSESANGEYMNAIWISGLHTTRFSNCKLEKRPANDMRQTHYRLQVGGLFGHLAMFLRVKTCTPLGCTRMNTAKNCCGRDLGFNFSFLMSCRPSSVGIDAIRDVKFEKISIDPMIVSAELMKGALKVDAMDISPQVEGAITDQIEAMLKKHVPWGGKPLSLEQLLNKIVWYNSPPNAGTCY